MPQQHMWEIAVDEVTDWMYSASDRLAETIKGDRAPFAADITDDEKLRFFSKKFFNPDGSENAKGRNEMMAALGPDEWAKVYKALVKPRFDKDKTRRVPHLAGMFRRESGDVDVEGLSGSE